jgi:hypothetical protein
MRTRLLLSGGDAMRVYAYWSQANPDLLAFTADQTGQNLPIERGPWEVSNDGNPIVTGDGGDPVTTIIQNAGYFIAIDKEVFVVKLRSANRRISC